MSSYRVRALVNDRGTLRRDGAGSEGRDRRIACVIVGSERRRESSTVVRSVALLRGFASWLFSGARRLAIRAILVPVAAFAPATGLPLVAPSFAFARALRVGGRNQGVCVSAASFDIALHVASVNVAEHISRGLDGSRQVANTSHGGDPVAEAARGVRYLLSNDAIGQLCGGRQRTIQAEKLMNERVQFLHSWLADASHVMRVQERRECGARRSGGGRRFGS
eukprot:276443-Pleurochrysis_carterae.AAC.8